MKKIFMLLFTVVAASACNTAKVSYDYDKSANFTKFKTYAYADNVATMPITTLDRDRLTRAIDKEMTSRGMTKGDAPDVLVDLHITTEKKESATATNYGGGGPWGWGYGAGFSTTQINVNDYVEGTLFINVVDAGSKNIAWQGRATKVLNPDAAPDAREASINNAVAETFKKYPVPAAK